MLDYQPIINDQIAYWERQPTDVVGNINSFNGTFAVSNINKVHPALRAYISEKFPSATRLARIPIEDVNDALNEVWNGPGSMPNVVKTTWEMKLARFMETVGEVSKKVFKDINIPTIDDNLDYVSAETDSVKSKKNGDE